MNPEANTFQYNDLRNRPDNEFFKDRVYKYKMLFLRTSKFPFSFRQ